FAHPAIAADPSDILQSGFAAQFHRKPGPRRAQIALHRRLRYLEGRRRLLEVQTSEIVQFEDAALPLVEGFEALQRFIELCHGPDVIVRTQEARSKRESRPASPPLVGLAGAGMVHKEVAQHARCEGEEMAPLPQSDVRGIEKAEGGP